MRRWLTFVACSFIAAGIAMYVTDYDYIHRTDKPCIPALFIIATGSIAAALSRKE